MVQSTKMGKREFARLIKANRMRGEKTILALQCVLVDGMSMAEAARASDCAPSNVSKALGRLNRDLCPHCGQVMPEAA